MEGYNLRAVCKAAKLRPLSDLTGDTKVMPFKVTKNCVKLELLDDAHIAYSQMTLDKEYFDEYDFEGAVEMCYEFAVSADWLKRAIRGIEDPDQTPAVFMYDASENKVFIESYDDHLHTRRVETSPVEHEAQPLTIPDTLYPARIEINGKQLGNVLRDVALSDSASITLSVSSKTLMIRTAMDATYHQHIFETTSRSRNGKVSIVLEGVTEVVQEFNAKVLLRTVKPLEFCDPLRLRLRDHLPLQLEAPLSADGKSYIICFVAPTLGNA